jgi:PAS domain S-box-containing protein
MFTGTNRRSQWLAATSATLAFATLALFVWSVANGQRATQLGAGLIAASLVFVHYLVVERVRASDRERMLALLRVLNRPGDLRELIKQITGFMQNWTGCSAVGVRLSDGEDFPYFETRGFDREFVLAENHLCVADLNGQILRDSAGNPVLECMCGNILRGRFDPSKPFFTRRGSFFSNRTTRLLATTSEKDRQARTRNRCNGEGYESVLLIPLTAGSETLGLLQFNDRAKGKFPPRKLRFLEEVADVVALSLGQRIAEQRLAKSEAQYRQIVETAEEGMLSLDADGKVVYLNARLATILAISVEAARGKKAEDFVLPEDLAMFRQRLTEGRAGQSGRDEVRLRRSDGSVAWCLISARPNLGPDGAFLGSFAMVSDMTLRKQVEDAWLAGETRYRSLFEHMLNGVAYCRMLFVDDEPCDWVYVMVNEAFETLTGLKDVVGKRVREVIPGIFEADGELFHIYGRVARGGAPKRFEYRVAVLDMWISVSVFSPEKDHFVTVFDVITERKRAEGERELLQTQLLQAQKLESIGRLAGGVAHDFNNMLSVINGHAEMALEEIPASHPLYESLWNILNAGRRSASLTRQLLAFARQQTIQPRVINLNQIVSGMLRLLGRLIGEDIELCWSPDAALWRARVDPSQIDQILANLAVNARDAIHGGGKVTLSTSNQVLAESDCSGIEGSAPGQYVCLSMADTGCGMDAQTLEHIFEPFFTTKKVGEGTGLGLSTVYGVVKQNGGFIGVHSEVGKGTTFKVYLPRADSVLTTTAETEAIFEPARAGETLLVVEDEETVLAMVRGQLEEAGYTVLATTSPEHAVELAASYQGTIHLLVTDLIMPCMNGRELARALAAARPGLKCLYMSGYPADVAAHHGIIDAGLQIIQKPFSLRTLAKAVREVLDEQ